MFTVEIKINGTLISHIYGHNEGDLPSGEDRYRYEYYETETRKVLNGKVRHRRTAGIRALVNAILTDVGQIEGGSLDNNKKKPECPLCESDKWNGVKCKHCEYPGK